MPAGFMPNGTVANHWVAGSLSAQKTITPMNASMVPCEAAPKQASGGMISPPARTSIRNRPPLISSTNRASCSAAPCNTSSDGDQVVDIRQCTFGWAMTFGASTTAEAPAAASTPPALTMNLRRSTAMASVTREGTAAVGDPERVTPSQRHGLVEAPSEMRDQPASCAWNFVKDAWTFRAMGLFSDSSLTTSDATFLRSRSTEAGNWRISTLPLNSVRSRSRAIAFFVW